MISQYQSMPSFAQPTLISMTNYGLQIRPLFGGGLGRRRRTSKYLLIQTCAISAAVWRQLKSKRFFSNSTQGWKLCWAWRLESGMNRNVDPTFLFATYAHTKCLSCAISPQYTRRQTDDSRQRSEQDATISLA